MRVSFSFAVHSHQPVGNFDHVMEKAFRQAYLPFIRFLARTRTFRASLHYSGSLLIWIERRHPELFPMLRALVRRGQVELLTGGFYEPILATLPEPDRLAQIRLLNRYLRERFGVIPTGAWVAERVWEPELARTFVNAGVRYVLLDDSHIVRAGIAPEESYASFVTDDGAGPLRIFPIHRWFRYRIPYAPPTEAIRRLQEIQKHGGMFVGYGDDGEKFGLWPGTDILCWNRKWLERFTRALRGAANVQSLTYGDAFRRYEPSKLIYPPPGVYAEMEEWTLPRREAEAFRKFHVELRKRILRPYRHFAVGGQFRGFFAKYEEANYLHKRMLDIRGTIRHAEAKTKHPLRKAWDELHRGQGNDVYWHGVFGGLYSTHLRHVAYTHLLSAETRAESVQHRGRPWRRSYSRDLDFDGQPEAVLENDRLKAVFVPHRGGMMVELDERARAMNFLNTLRRREEAYHEQLRSALRHPPRSRRVRSIHEQWQFESDVRATDIVDDPYRRGAWIDHVLRPGTTLGHFSRNRHRESGSLPSAPYQLRVKNSAVASAISLERQEPSFTVSKRFALTRGSSNVAVGYRIQNVSNRALSIWFGVELGFTLLSDDNRRAILLNGDGQRLSLRDVREHRGIESITAQTDDLDLGLSWRFSQPFTLWRFPINTVSLSETGFRKTYQSSVLFLHANIKILPRLAWEFTAEQRLQ